MKKICAMAGVLMAILITSIMVNVKKSNMQKDLAKEVFRFHVLANSDSEEDQSLKMKVKEEILSYMKQELPDSDSVQATKTWAKNHIAELEKVAREVVETEGYPYEVKAQVTKCQFPEKTYGDITFPAGEYEALRIQIGEAQGQNWWGVL